MDLPDDPAELTPEQRLREVASLLAAGLLRLRRRPILPGTPAPENLSESTAQGLELSPDPRLSVVYGARAES